MDKVSRQDHWNNIYGNKDENTLSWFQQELSTLSMSLIQEHLSDQNASVIDIGGGTSRLVDQLVDQGVGQVSVLDISSKALEISKTRLADQAEQVDWICADLTTWIPERRYTLWHDRAVFHFLTDAKDRQHYIAALCRGVSVGGTAIIASFALDGPVKCSGLPVQRYSHETLTETLGQGFRFIKGVSEEHQTPSGSSQNFQYSLFERTDESCLVD